MNKHWDKDYYQNKNVQFDLLADLGKKDTDIAPLVGQKLISRT